LPVIPSKNKPHIVRGRVKQREREQEKKGGVEKKTRKTTGRKDKLWTYDLKKKKERPVFQQTSKKPRNERGWEMGNWEGGKGRRTTKKTQPEREGELLGRKKKLGVGKKWSERGKNSVVQ